MWSYASTSPYALTACKGTSVLISCVLGWDATSLDEQFTAFWRIVMSSCSGPNRPRRAPVWIPQISALQAYVRGFLFASHYSRFCYNAAVYMTQLQMSSYFPLLVFLSAFAKLRKVTISFVMSVRLSVRMEQFGSHWVDFHEISYLRVSRKSVGKI